MPQEQGRSGEVPAVTPDAAVSADVVSTRAPRFVVRRDGRKFGVLKDGVVEVYDFQKWWAEVRVC
jgi:hypothetical protein